jgi:nitrous oxide reductase
VVHAHEADEDEDHAHEEEETLAADIHEHEESGGHAGHDHGMPSFESYGLVRSAKGFKEFNIKLSQFKYFPEVISVEKGDRIVLNLDSVDVEHGFFIDGYGIDVLVPEKEFKTIEFVANKSGAFRFRCSSTCGAFHPFMIGKMSVSPNSAVWGSFASVVILPVGILAILRFKKRRKANDQT